MSDCSAIVTPEPATSGLLFIAGIVALTVYAFRRSRALRRRREFKRIVENGEDFPPSIVRPKPPKVKP